MNDELGSAPASKITLTLNETQENYTSNQRFILLFIRFMTNQCQDFFFLSPLKTFSGLKILSGTISRSLNAIRNNIMGQSKNEKKHVKTRR